MNGYYEKESSEERCASCGHMLSRTPKRKTNFLIFLFLSVCLPGTNFMYMGMMKRGLFFLSSFFIAIYAISVTAALPFVFVTAIIYIASFFDGFSTRRRLLSGEFVNDSVTDITSFFGKHKTISLLAMFLTVILSVLSRVYDRVNDYLGHPFYRSDFPMIVFSVGIVLLGLYFISKSKKSESVIDKRMN